MKKLRTKTITKKITNQQLIPGNTKLTLKVIKENGKIMQASFEGSAKKAYEEALNT